MYLRTYVRMCVCAYVRMCVCAYVRMCVRAYWGWLESWMLLRSYLAVETRQQAPCKKKTHRENAPELLVHL